MDKKNILIAVFSSLQGLEKCADANQRMFDQLDHGSEILGRSVEDHYQVLGSMRRTANKLQFALAKDNWCESVRLLQVFYGLRHMVRPEIMSAFRSLANKELKLPQIEQHAVIH